MRNLNKEALAGYRKLYVGKLFNGEKSKRALILDTNLKQIKATLNQDYYDALADHSIGTVFDPKYGRSEEPTTDEEFEDAKSYALNDAKDKLIGLYIAAKRELSLRSRWDKFFHPFRTHAENKAFAAIETELEEKGITSLEISEAENLINSAYDEEVSAVSEGRKEKIEIDLNDDANFKEASIQNVSAPLQLDLEASI